MTDYITIFEQAAITKLRFFGHLTVEELYDLPIKSKERTSLDDLAHRYFEAINDAKCSTLGQEKYNISTLILALEIINHVIVFKSNVITTFEKDKQSIVPGEIVQNFIDKMGEKNV